MQAVSRIGVGWGLYQILDSMPMSAINDLNQPNNLCDLSF